MTLVVAEAGVGALGAQGGRVSAAGAGWAWLSDREGRPVHVTGEGGPRGPLTAVVGRDTAVATQFHPEKSQRFGLRLIANFLQWNP